MRKLIFNLLFTLEERIIISNALYERSFEDSIQENKEMNESTKNVCRKLVRELN